MALDSLAIWPVLAGLLFLLRSPGVAYNEVVVSLLEKPGAYIKLRKFAVILALITSTILFCVVSTPAARFWFINITSLPDSLYLLARNALWFSLLTPGAAVFQSWYQGILLNSGKTRGIPEAVGVFLISTIILYIFGIITEIAPGIYIGTLGFSLGMTLQALWLRQKSRVATTVLYENQQV